MAGYPSVSAYNFGTDSLSNDKYWQQYWIMSQYADSLAKAQAQGYSATSQKPAAGTAASNPSFQGGSTTNVGTVPRAAEEKSSNHTAAVLTTAGIALAGTAWWLVSRGKSAGAKGFMNQLKAGMKSFGKKSAEESSKITMRTVNGKNIFTIPDRTQVLRGANIAGKKDTLGFAVNEGLKWTDDAARIKGYHIELKGTDGVLNRITVRDGKVVNCTNLSKGLKEEGRDFTEAYNNGTLDAGFKKQIDDAILAMGKKDSAAIPTGVSVKNISYGQEVASGSQALYLANPSKAGVTDGIKLVKTNRFEQTADEVYQAKLKNKEFKEAMIALEDNTKTKFENWNVAEASYTPATGTKNKMGVLWPSDAKINIANNTPVSITEHGITYKPGDPRYDSLAEQFGSLFRDSLKHQDQFENVVRVFG